MRPEDLDKARKLIQSSKILSSVERAEWSQLLPEMNDKQVFELIRILAPKETPQSQAARPASQMPKVDIKQKEITTSRPFYEPEIAAPKAPANLPIKQSTIVPPPADPKDLQQRVANIVKEMDQRKPGAAPVPTPAPIRAPQPYQLPQSEFKAPAATGKPNFDLQEFLEKDEEQAKPLPPLDQKVEEQRVAQMRLLGEDVLDKKVSTPAPAPIPTAPQVRLETAADFAKLNTDFLSNRNLEDVHNQITEALQRVSRKEHGYDIVASYESSPLHAAYVNLGSELLNDPNPDRIKAYESAQNKLRQQGLPALNKQAFEFLTDLRSELQRYY